MVGLKSAKPLLQRGSCFTQASVQDGHGPIGENHTGQTARLVFLFLLLVAVLLDTPISENVL